MDKPKVHTIKIPVEICEKCGEPIADALFAEKIGAKPRSSYCSLSKYCRECALWILSTINRKQFRFLFGAKIIKIEVDQSGLRNVTLAKGGREWSLRSDGCSDLSVSEILKRRKEK
jgi:hypothetical protein